MDKRISAEITKLTNDDLKRFSNITRHSDEITFTFSYIKTDGSTINFYTKIILSPRFPSMFIQQIIILEPFYFESDRYWIEKSEIQFPLTPALSIIKFTEMFIPKLIEFKIHLDELTNKPAVFLVIGSSPIEKRNGRVFYDDERVFLLDKPFERDNIYPRFLPCDFSSLLKLRNYSSLLSKKFTEICFDWAVFNKFRIDTQESPFKERLQCLVNMLSDNGRLWVEDYNKAPGGGRTEHDETDYASEFKKVCSVIRNVDIGPDNIVNHIKDSVIVPLVFPLGYYPETTIIALQRIQPAGEGGRKSRKSKSRKRKSWKRKYNKRKSRKV